MSTLTAQDVLDDERAALTVQAMTATAERPTGLTSSAVGFCSAKAGYILAGAEPTDMGDPWNAARGNAIHEYVGQAHKALHGDDVALEVRMPVTIAGLDISGKADQMCHRTGVLRERKTRTPEQVRYHQMHGPADEDRWQAAINAVANKARQAFVLYYPTVGTLDHIVCYEVDIPTAFAEAEQWLLRIIGEDPEQLPKDPPWNVCEATCQFFSRCRSGWQEMEPSITDPRLVEVVEATYFAAETRKEFEEREKALKSALDGLTGHTDNYKIVRQVVGPTETKAGYTSLRVVRKKEKKRAAKRAAA